MEEKLLTQAIITVNDEKTARKLIAGKDFDIVSERDGCLFIAKDGFTTDILAPGQWKEVKFIYNAVNPLPN